MEGLDLLKSSIYHERQQPGSMLCAQHALNNLLQDNLFSAPDLSSIAADLDQLEESVDEDRRGHTSANMDDTGFFSVQVLENALKVWGFSLARWRSEEMRSFQDRPHTQLAFILNLEQHWLTLRRFGSEGPPDSDGGAGHWYNLNSSNDAPEWVSKTFLGMVLHQMEAEGYSVFAIIPTDSQSGLPRSDADAVALSIPDSATPGSPAPPGAFRSDKRTGASASTGDGHARGAEFDFGDEDMELQAALQASLMGGTADELLVPEPGTSAAAAIPRLAPATPFGGGEAPRSRWTVPDDNDIDMDSDSDEVVNTPSRPQRTNTLPPETDVNTDPVAAGMARNAALLESMRRQQAIELNYATQFDEEDQERAAARARRQREEEEEEEMVRRAIEESRAMHGGSPDADATADREARGSQTSPPEVGTPTGVPQTTVPPQSRVYDDEDAELQAALRASMENVPPGYQMPESPPRIPAPPATAKAPPLARTESEASVKTAETYETESEAGTEGEAPAPQPQESVEEMRQKRLARFGA